MDEKERKTNCSGRSWGGLGGAGRSLSGMQEQTEQQSLASEPFRSSIKEKLFEKLDRRPPLPSPPWLLLFGIVCFSLQLLSVLGENNGGKSY